MSAQREILFFVCRTAHCCCCLKDLFPFGFKIQILELNSHFGNVHFLPHQYTGHAFKDDLLNLILWSKDSILYSSDQVIELFLKIKEIRLLVSFGEHL